jgi:hypothetical protein
MASLKLIFGRNGLPKRSGVDALGFILVNASLDLYCNCVPKPCSPPVESYSTRKSWWEGQTQDCIAPCLAPENQQPHRKTHATSACGSHRRMCSPNLASYIISGGNLETITAIRTRRNMQLAIQSRQGKPETLHWHLHRNRLYSRHGIQQEAMNLTLCAREKYL